MIEWTKHAESKAATSLASAGVLGGLLYTLVSKAGALDVAATIAAVACGAAIAATAVAAGFALRPRIRRRQAVVGLIFYRGIAAGYAGDAPSYGNDFAKLIGDRRALVAALAEQILANAEVADRKYRASNLAVSGLLATLALLAATALLVLGS